MPATADTTAGDRRPAEAGGPLVRLGKGRPVRKTAAIAKLLRIERAEIRREERRLLGGPGGRRNPLGELAPAMHGGDGIPSLSMSQRTTYSDRLVGHLVSLRRHAPGNLATFQRWYSDPEVARLTRYQDGPMRPEEIERFFTARVLGPDTFTMAIHERASDRLIGTCAFSQLDGDNGSALFHITIGEKDAWGRGFGTEATQLMLDHAFTRLGLHRVGLSVFSFNERAIRSYLKAGFTIEGRAREAIWRNGRLWDEISMSVLESEWRRTHPGTRNRATVGAGQRGDDGWPGRSCARRNGRSRHRVQPGIDPRRRPRHSARPLIRGQPGTGGRRREGIVPRADRRRRATPSTTRGRPPWGWSEPWPEATSSRLRRWTR